MPWELADDPRFKDNPDDTQDVVRCRSRCQATCAQLKQCLQPDDCWSVGPLIAAANAFAWHLFLDWITQWDRGGMAGMPTRFDPTPALMELVFGYRIRGLELLDVTARLRSLEAQYLAIAAADAARRSNG